MNYKSTTLTIALMCIAFESVAGGFQSFPSMRGSGRAHSGIGIDANDPISMTVNPASGSLFKGTVASHSLQLVSIKNVITSAGSTQSFLSPTGKLTVPSQGAIGEAEELVPVLNGALIHPSKSNDRVTYGVSLSPAFGLGNEYDDDWTGRFHALESQLKTVDITPSVSYEVSDQVSVGAGLILEYAKAKLTQKLFLGAGAPEGKAAIEGDNFGVGVSIGAMINATEATRFGISLRSPVKHDLKGDRTVSGTGFSDGSVDAVASIKLPMTATFSVWHDVDDRLSLTGTLMWADWSSWKEIRASFADGSPDFVTPQNWEDSLTYSVGAEYRLNDRWTLMAGIGRDETPIPSANLRTPRNSDTDKTWLAAGASYTTSGAWAFDFNVRLISAEQGGIDNTINLISSLPGVATDRLVGNADLERAIVVGFQARKSF